MIVGHEFVGEVVKLGEGVCIHAYSTYLYVCGKGRHTYSCEYPSALITPHWKVL